MVFSEDACEWLGRATGIPDLDLDIEQMRGANSSWMFLVQSAMDARCDQFVLRVLHNREWLAEEPDLPAHESAALEAAQKAGLRAPQPIDFTSKDIGFGGPVVLMSHLEGYVEICPDPADFGDWLENLARELASIHRHKAENFEWNFSSWVDKTALAPPPWTKKPRIWERAIEISLGPAPQYSPVFLHRDYHPTNVLWQERALSGVVDWINACRGPAGVDVAHCRTNLAQMFGLEAADEFLERYIEHSDDFEYNPYWDIESVLDMNLPLPEFYKPWQEFGLDVIPLEVLEKRIDSYLQSVVNRLNG